MPMLPSSRSAVRQRPAHGIRSNTDRSRTDAPRARARPNAAGETSIPRATRPLTASAATWRPGPQPTSSTGATTRARTRASMWSAASVQVLASVARPSRTCRRAAGFMRSTPPRSRPRRQIARSTRDDATRERRAGYGRGHAASASCVVVDVEQHGKPTRAESEVVQALLLGGASASRAHLHAEEHARIRSLQSDRPPSAVGGTAEHRIRLGAVQFLRTAGEQRGRDLWGIHADEQRTSVDVRERGRDARVETSDQPAARRPFRTAATHPADPRGPRCGGPPGSPAPRAGCPRVPPRRPRPLRQECTAGTAAS